MYCFNVVTYSWSNVNTFKRYRFTSFFFSVVKLTFVLHYALWHELGSTFLTAHRLDSTYYDKQHVSKRTEWNNHFLNARASTFLFLRPYQVRMLLLTNPSTQTPQIHERCAWQSSTCWSFALHATNQNPRTRFEYYNGSVLVASRRYVSSRLRESKRANIRLDNELGLPRKRTQLVTSSLPERWLR